MGAGSNERSSILKASLFLGSSLETSQFRVDYFVLFFYSVRDMMTVNLINPEDMFFFLFYGFKLST